MTRRRASAASRFAARIAGPALIAAVVLAGCRAKGKDFENENDALRRRIVDLETELADARATETEMRAKYEEVRRSAAGLAEQQALDALPRCAGLTVDRLSGPIDSDGDGSLDAVDVYIRPYDGRRRFVQVVGSLTVEALVLGPTGSGDAPRPLGAVTLTPPDLREAYRASPLGTHYTVRLPLDSAIAGPATLVLRARFVDAVSGLIHEDQRLIDLTSGPPG